MCGLAGLVNIKELEDKESLEKHLDDHGSLNFSYLSQMLTEEDIEDLLKNYLDQFFFL